MEEATYLRKMKQFYLTFPILDAVRPELSWTHYRTLLRVEDAAAREVVSTATNELQVSAVQAFQLTV